MFFLFQRKTLLCLFPLLVVAGNAWHSQACRCITPVSASVFKGACPSVFHVFTQHFPLCVSSVSIPHYTRIPVIELSPTLNQQDLIYFHQIISAKALFSNKVTFTGPRSQDFNTFQGTTTRNRVLEKRCRFQPHRNLPSLGSSDSLGIRKVIRI